MVWVGFAAASFSLSTVDVMIEGFKKKLSESKVVEDSSLFVHVSVVSFTRYF